MLSLSFRSSNLHPVAVNDGVGVDAQARRTISRLAEIRADCKFKLLLSVGGVTAFRENKNLIDNLTSNKDTMWVTNNVTFLVDLRCRKIVPWISTYYRHTLVD